MGGGSAALAIGAAAGALNGLLAVLVQIQPIVATLGTYLIFTGLTLTIVPAPTGSVPHSIQSLSGELSIVPLLALAAVWLGIKQLPYYDQLMAVGGDDRAASCQHPSPWSVSCRTAFPAFSPARRVRAHRADRLGRPQCRGKLTLLSISAVALGGVSLAGGRGGMLAAVIGASDIFLLQSALTYFNVSTFILQIAYGLILVASISLNGLTVMIERRAAR